MSRRPYGSRRRRREIRPARRATSVLEAPPCRKGLWRGGRNSRGREPGREPGRTP
ncbi:hypothetical protein Y09_1877 [Brachybacterium sp. SW0106-09]|nr:hypothetical protein Y09_1877 [Brachybacterium sp. SW0106-09]